MPSLCNRCCMKFRCCLNYDGKSCKESRNVEPTNYDVLKDCLDEYSDIQLALFLVDIFKGQGKDFLEGLDSTLDGNELYNKVFELLQMNRNDWIRSDDK